MRQSYDILSLVRATKNVLLVIFVFFCILPSNVFAHGFGKSLEAQVDGYLVDIGYDPENGTALQTHVYDISLLNSETKEAVEFTDVWVRISKDKKTYLATGISKARIGKTTLAYIYPDAGNYQMSVRFQNGKDKIVETVFDLSVVENKDQSKTKIPSWGFVLVGLFLGGIITFITRKTLIRS